MYVAKIALAAVLAGAPLVAIAQETVNADEQILIRQGQGERRAIFLRNLELTDEESGRFWPVYDAYETASKRLTEQRLALLHDYADRYATLSDADAQAIFATRLRLDREAAALRQKYARKVARALPASKALRYVQLQDRIDTALASQAYAIIPIAP
jgi:Spy/CpxP family protein refolding chaperone